VFHPPGGDGVVYSSGHVHVDGVAVEIHVYGQRIQAAECFKYLGVTLRADGGVHAHAQARVQAFQRGLSMFFARLSRIPSYGHSFMLFVLNALVMPIACYGLELFSWDHGDLNTLVKLQSSNWRRLLKVGGRAPIDACWCLLQLDCVVDVARVRRLSHFLRLLNAPPDSYEHVALIVLRELPAERYLDAVADLQLCYPWALICGGLCRDGPFLYSTGRWSDEGVWMSAQPHSFNIDLSGRRSRTPKRTGIVSSEARAVRAHIRNVSQDLRSRLRRERQASSCQSLLEKAGNPYSKTLPLAHRLCQSGPPLHIALEWIGPLHHRAAISSMLAGDWFLGTTSPKTCYLILNGTGSTSRVPMSCLKEFAWNAGITTESSTWKTCLMYSSCARAITDAGGSLLTTRLRKPLRN